MSKRIYIEVKIAKDDDTGASTVERTLIETMCVCYPWEVRTLFERLVEKVASECGFKE